MFTANDCVFHLEALNNLNGALIILNSATDFKILKTFFYLQSSFKVPLILSVSSILNEISSNLYISDSEFIAKDKITKSHLTDNYFLFLDRRVVNIQLQNCLFKLGTTSYKSLMFSEGAAMLRLQGNTFLGNDIESFSRSIGLFAIKYQSDNSKGLIEIIKNKFFFNRVDFGSILSLEQTSENSENEFIHLTLNFIDNSVRFNRARMKGGFLYLNNSENTGLSLGKISSNISGNIFKMNIASLGPIIYEEFMGGLSKLVWDNLITKANKFVKNTASDSLGDFSSSIKYVRISKKSEDELILYKNTEKPRINLGNRIPFNRPQAECYFFISFFDSFGNKIRFDNLFEENGFLFSESESKIDKKPFLLLTTGVGIYFRMQHGALCAYNIFHEVTQNIDFSKEFNIVIDPQQHFKSYGTLDGVQNPLVNILFIFQKCSRGNFLNVEDYQCVACPVNTFSLQENFYSIKDYIPCSDLANYNCYGADLRSPKANYWKVDEDSQTFLRCPRPDTCRGDTNFLLNLTSSECLNCSISGVLNSEAMFEYKVNYTSMGVCKIGYEGVLCAECSVPEYGLSENFKCSLCENSSVYLKEGIIIVIKTLLLVFTIWKSVKMNDDLSNLKVMKIF